MTAAWTEAVLAPSPTRSVPETVAAHRDVGAWSGPENLDTTRPCTGAGLTFFRVPTTSARTSLRRYEEEGDFRAAVHHRPIQRPGLHELSGPNCGLCDGSFSPRTGNQASDHPQSGVPACAVPERPRPTRFPQAVPRLSCATMGVRQGAVRGGQPSP